MSARAARLLNLFLIPIQSFHNLAAVFISFLQCGKPPVSAGAENFKALKDKLSSFDLFRAVTLGWFSSKVITSVTIGGKCLDLWREGSTASMRWGYERKSENDERESHVPLLLGLQFGFAIASAKRQFEIAAS
jgi:hypothetical protein